MKAVVALGSNLGDRFDYLQKAVNEINSLHEIKISEISSVYETLPVGGPEQGNYLNAVITLNTKFEAEELLLKLLLIELNLGRQREIAWGPRTIDLDLIWFEDQTINLENLVLPHPRAHKRCFVIKPWLEIEPNAKIGNTEIQEFLKDLDCSGVNLFPTRLVNG
jgi:2-amino-4-hydroxy-6-hydroxymethyldihydropteridine diphosphokinase